MNASAHAASPRPVRARRALAWMFWIGLIGFIAVDLAVSAPRDRFDEPPMLALGSGKAAGAGHCSGSTR